MVANILPTDTPLTQGVGSKGQIIPFSESSRVAYQIIWNCTEHHESKYAVITHTNDHWGGVKRSFLSFQKLVMLHIRLKWKKCRPTYKVTL